MRLQTYLHTQIHVKTRAATQKESNAHNSLKNDRKLQGGVVYLGKRRQTHMHVRTHKQLHVETRGETHQSRRTRGGAGRDYDDSVAAITRCSGAPGALNRPSFVVYAG